MKSFSKKSLSGLTFIETVIVVGIFSLMLIALVDLLIGYYQLYDTQSATIDVGGSAVRLVTELHTAALQSDQILASHACNGTTYTSGATTVVFEMPSVDSSGNIIANTYDYECVYVSGTNVYAILVPGSGSARPSVTRTLTSVLSQLSLTYDNADFTKVTEVTVDATTSETSVNQTPTTHIKEVNYLRNL